MPLSDRFKKILSPSKTALLLWSIIISPVLLVYLYKNSFDWLIGVRTYMKIMFALLLTVTVIFFVLDYFLKTSLKKYSLLSVGLWLVICGLFFPAKNFLEQQSENRAAALIESVEKYKKEFGNYPKSLANQYFVNYPLRSYVGSYYQYYSSMSNTNGKIFFVIYYYTFNGRLAKYNSRSRAWAYYVDD